VTKSAGLKRVRNNNINTNNLHINVGKAIPNTTLTLNLLGGVTRRP